MGLAHGQDLAFEDVFDHTCDATNMYASIRKADLAQLGTWKDNFEMVTLNEGCPGQEDEYGNIIFSAGSLRNLPLECGTQYSDDGAGKITFWNVVQYTPPNDSPITRDASGLYNFSCIYDLSVLMMLVNVVMYSLILSNHVPLEVSQSQPPVDPVLINQTF